MLLFLPRIGEQWNKEQSSFPDTAANNGYDLPLNLDKTWETKGNLRGISRINRVEDHKLAYLPDYAVNH